MYQNSIASPRSIVNTFSRKRQRPDMRSLSERWNALCASASLAPASERAGIHRARTALLDRVPTWKLPDVLDQLARGVEVCL